LEPVWLPQVYEVVRAVESNSRVFEVKSLVNPRQKPRVLHIDMLKPLGDLGSQYLRTRRPGTHDPFHQLKGHELQELFEDDGRDLVTETVESSARNRTSNNDQSPQKPRMTRSRCKVTPSSTAEVESDSDEESYDVSDSVSLLGFDAVEAEHAPLGLGLGPDRDIQPVPQLMRSESVEDLPEVVLPAPEIDVSVPLNSSDEDLEPVDGRVHVGAEADPQRVDPQPVGPLGDAREDDIEPEEVPYDVYPDGRRRLPYRESRGAPPERLGETYTHLVTECRVPVIILPNHNKFRCEETWV